MPPKTGPAQRRLRALECRGATFCCCRAGWGCPPTPAKPVACSGRRATEPPKPPKRCPQSRCGPEPYRPPMPGQHSAARGLWSAEERPSAAAGPAGGVPQLRPSQWPAAAEGQQSPPSRQNDAHSPDAARNLIGLRCRASTAPPAGSGVQRSEAPAAGGRLGVSPNSNLVSGLQQSRGRPSPKAPRRCLGTDAAPNLICRQCPEEIGHGPPHLPLLP